MKTFVQDGDVMNYANAGSAILSGAIVQVGNLVGVAALDIAATTGTGAVYFEGVFSLTKVGSQAWAQGDPIFYDHTNVYCTKTASSDADTLIGHAWETVGSGAGETTGIVKLLEASGTKATAIAALTGTLTGTVDGAMVDVAATAAATVGGSSPTAAQVDTGIALAVSTIVTGVNTQNKEMLTTINAIIAALKVAGIMDN